MPVPAPVRSPLGGVLAGATAGALLLVAATMLSRPTTEPSDTPIPAPSNVAAAGRSAAPLPSGNARPTQGGDSGLATVPRVAVPPVPPVAPAAPSVAGAPPLHPAPVTSASTRLAGSASASNETVSRVPSDSSVASADPSRAGRRDAGVSPASAAISVNASPAAVAPGAPDTLVAPRDDSSIPAAFVEPSADEPVRAPDAEIEQAIRDEFARRVKPGGDDDRSAGTVESPEANSADLRPKAGYPSDPWERAARLAEEEFRGLRGDAAWAARTQRGEAQPTPPPL